MLVYLIYQCNTHRLTRTMAVRWQDMLLTMLWYDCIMYTHTLYYYSVEYVWMGTVNFKCHTFQSVCCVSDLLSPTKCKCKFYSNSNPYRIYNTISKRVREKMNEWTNKRTHKQLYNADFNSLTFGNQTLVGPSWWHENFSI